MAPPTCIVTVKRLEAMLVCSRRTAFRAALMSGAFSNPIPDSPDHLGPEQKPVIRVKRKVFIHVKRKGYQHRSAEQRDARPDPVGNQSGKRGDNGHAYGRGRQDDSRIQSLIVQDVLQEKGKEEHGPEDGHGPNKVNDVGHQEIMVREEMEVDDRVFHQESGSDEDGQSHDA